MPTYTFKCLTCDTIFEKERCTTETTHYQCPECMNLAKKIPSLPARTRVGSLGKGGGNG